MRDRYQHFYRQCVRNLAMGVLLSIIPAAAFYWFIFELSQRQMLILGMLGVADLAAFFPLDLLVLSWTLHPVRAALSESATREQQRGGLRRLLESPWIVIQRVYLVHAPLAT